MPRALDTFAIALALTACGPMGANSAPAGRLARTADQIRPTASATIPTPAIPDGFECKKTQNEVKEAITRCCLTITPHKACHDVGNADFEGFSISNTIELGGGKVPNYTHFKNGIPPAIYMNYLAHTAKNATELATVLTAFVKYRTIDEDNMLTPEEIISEGAGDCDNVANLFVDLLGKLGKKTGYDYKARVLGLEDAEHAVAIFLDRDGKWKALDFSLPFYEIGKDGAQVDLFGASAGFSTHRGEKRRFFERKKLGPAAGKGARIDMFISSETLAPDGKEYGIGVEFDYSPEINPDLFLKDYDWRKVELTHIHYKNDTTAYYHKGVFYQLTEKSRITFYDADRKVTEIQYKDHPTISVEWFTPSGQTERRNLKNGNTEIYSDGVLFQFVYAKGPVAHEVLYASGKIRQKIYRDGKIEYFDENGKMIRRQDSKGRMTVIYAAPAGAHS